MRLLAQRGPAGEQRWRRLRRVARAASGDPAALRALVDEPTAEVGGLEARLALAARNRQLSVPTNWRTALRSSATNWLLINRTYEAVATTLDDIGWSAIKGFDTSQRFYLRREERPAKDLDLLIDEQDAERAIARLEGAGWRSLFSSQRATRFLYDEGYCWQAWRPGHALLELHLRLWPSLPKELASAILVSSQNRRPTAAHAYLLAALHFWQQPVPRSLIDLSDLDRIAASSVETALAAEIIASTRQHQLQLPLLLSATLTNELWPRPLHAQLEQELEGDLSRRECYLRRTMTRIGPDAIEPHWLQLSRWLTGRPSRRSPRAAVRRLWAHPGVVERETPTDWSWPRRRWVHLLRRLWPATPAASSPPAGSGANVWPQTRRIS